MKNISIFFSGLLLGTVFLFLPIESKAATFFLVPSNTNLGIGEKFSIEVKIDSEGASLNGSQATIRFPADVLEVSSIDKNNSAFSFWLEDPSFSNKDGTISFTGGTPYGVSGSSVNVFKVFFVAKGSGNAEITFNDAAIAASDGSGTNIFSKVSGSAIAVSPTKVVTQVQQITREPVKVSGLPIKPVIRIPLYPDADKWYNPEGAFNVNWDLPLDISGVSTALNKTPNFIPSEKSEGLFDNKTFNAISDGNWYLHIRFKNNVGWGPTTHQKISIDTQPPLGFDISVLEGETTDNPAPTIQFKTTDALSGIKEYDIRIDSGELIKVPASEVVDSYKLPLQSPGTHQVTVRALDQADNGIENRVSFNITAIDSPQITYVTKELFSDEERGLTIKGASLAGVDIILSLYQSGALIKQETTHTDERGIWEFVFNEPLKNGSYVIKAQSKDSRGALSMEAESAQILVKNRPVIQIGSFTLGSGGAFVILLVIMAVGFGGGFLFYKKRQGKIGLRVSTATIDFEKMLKIIKVDMEKLEQFRKTPNESDDKFIFDKIREDLKKMENYLKKEIEKIKD